MHTGIFVAYLTILQLSIYSCVPDSYLQQRKGIINGEIRQRLGSDLQLDATEQSLDNFLLRHKQTTYTDARVGKSLFPPSVNFFQSKKTIDDSPIFKVIQQMPKGCALHTHDSSITSLDWVIQNATYRDNCFICFNSTTGQPKLHFFAKPPVNKGCYWEDISAVRKRSGDSQTFDQQLYNNFTIIVDNPEDKYRSVNEVWSKFNSYFTLIQGVFTYAPVFKDYFQRALTEFYADNVQCLEVRATLPDVYELDGTVHDKNWAVEAYRSIAAEFTKQNPNFLGVKVIYSGIRFLPKSSILASVKIAMGLVTRYPGFLVGYDLVGQEGLGEPLLHYIDDLLYPSQQTPPVHLPYFFHSGETAWQDTQVDYNLIDAVLLNTSRIGHGYAITKHPYISQLVKKKGIAVEVNPISNQVLKLVDDLRNHPAAHLMTGNFPVVISSDDPAVWKAKPLSHDFYMAFMALCGEDEGLRILKQLAINSIKYSAMSDSEKTAAMTSWERQWSKFILGTKLNDRSTSPTHKAHIIG